MSTTYKATKARVHNRGVPPDSFLDQLVLFGNTSPNEIFTINDNYDIYSVLKDALGPYRSTKHRRAVMLEALRVLAGFESSWNWDEGVDTTNPSSNTPCTEEAGAFQCSGNSMHFDQSLRELCVQTYGSTSCPGFIKASKTFKQFAVEYCARLLRFTTNHHGPIKRGDVAKWVSRKAVDEFMTLI
jgi:hypothetical protein